MSGGLRATTQIIGCAVSLLIISPHMTFVTLLCIPAVIATGSAIGSLLRQTSRKAQAQVLFLSNELKYYCIEYFYRLKKQLQLQMKQLVI